MKKSLTRKYDFGELKKESMDIESIPKGIRGRMKYVGIDLKRGSGSYVQIDHSSIYQTVSEYLKSLGVVVMSTIEAYEKFAWARDYFWKALRVDQDPYINLTRNYWRHGYFIYVPPKVKVIQPIQACFFVTLKGIAQPVHNIVIVDEDAELNLVTGCATMSNEGLHIGVSEFYVKKRAKLTFTMIHGWAPKFEVKPRTSVIVEDGGTYVSYYVNLYPVHDLDMYPTTYLYKSAKGYMTSVLLGRKNSFMDVGSKIEFLGEGSRGEIVSRSIIRDQAKIIMRGHLVGKAEKTRGHLECRSLLLSQQASVITIPQLESHVEGSELTHEAAIGRISEEQLYYLMAKGFTEEEAVSLIVRGFIEVGLTRLPPQVRIPLKSALRIIERLARG